MSKGEQLITKCNSTSIIICSRESLRDINQSDHYWSFQISKNICLCLEEELCQSKSLTKRCTGSLQKLNEIDCTSITHECNGLKIRNCYIHCPSLDFPQKNNELKQADTPIPKTLCAKENKATCTELPPKQPRALHKTNENKPQFCHKYINTLPNSNLKPSSKIKFPSQSNLSNISKSSGSLKKKNSHGSCQDISSMIKGNHCVSPNTKLENGSGLKVQQKGVNTAESELKREIKFKKPKKELKPLLLSQSRQSLHDYAPVSRTTRKMYDGNKIVPFVTFGCNNNNIDIGTKRTHNVLASKVEVYPNALTAKQQKKDLILKYLQSEKEFQKKCFPENLKKVSFRLNFF